MTRHEATIKLVVRVLRLKVCSGKQEGDGTPAVVILDEVGGLNEYDPWTNVDQALELAEAWCRAKPTDRSMDIDFLPAIERCWVVRLLRKREAPWPSAVASTLAAALTVAVCEAEGLEVEKA